jgi:acyl-CoA reductase-like NAD-dependent aldehyde dehydrogenase
MSSDTQCVLINGEWKASKSTGSFQPVSPLDGKPIGEIYPVSDWVEIEEALAAGNQQPRGKLRGMLVPEGMDCRRAKYPLFAS